MTPERMEEAKRIAEALTIPMAGKYISTDDIKAGGQMIKELLENKPVKRPWINLNVKSLMAGTLACLIIGFCLGKIYTWDSIIVDCKILGAFRVSSTAFQCKMLAP